MIKEKLRENIAKTLNLPAEEIILEHPDNLSHGDFSTNIALIKGKTSNQNPKTLAESFAAKLSASKISEVEKIEVAGPGFINFHLSRDFFSNSIKEIFKDKSFGKNKSLSGEKYFIEHTQPNPFKAFHIGHFMNNAIGESIYRLNKNSDAEVRATSYHGDVGMHVAKSIWGMMKSGKNSTDFSEVYAIGNKAYENEEGAKKEIAEINKKIYDKSDKNINAIYENGKKVSLEHFRDIYKKLGSEFDETFFESETGEIGKKIVLENLGKVFEESDGAIVYKGEKVGLHTRVFLNSEKQPTYEAKEIGLVKKKKEIFSFDQSITITANEQNDFFAVCESAIGEVFPELKGKLKHISHGMMRLPSGKMSSRTGDVITALSLIEDVKKKVLEKMKGREIKNIDEEAEKIAIGAIKFSILKQHPGKDIIFDLDKSISFEGDSGPYLQYTAVRAQSVLNKEGKLSFSKLFSFSSKTPTNVSEIERLLYRLPEIIERAAKEYYPQFVVSYLLEVAGAFNSFYSSNQIIGSEYENYYLSLTRAVRRVLENGLKVLAIKIPEKM